MQKMLTQRRRAKQNEGGFTLIELLIVVVILGILVAIVLFAVGGFTGTSAQAACKTDMKQVSTAASAFYAQNGKWPAAAGDLSPTYMQSIPPSGDPLTNGSHYAVTIAYASPTTVTGTFDNSGASKAC